MSAQQTRGRFGLLGAFLVGIGLAGLLDVIVFHHILQTHHLLSNLYDPHTHVGLRQNIYYDGLFSLLMLGVVLFGGTLLWTATNRSTQRQSGFKISGILLVGMGLFNTIDGIVSHYILDIHDVVHGTTVWNPPWILVSVVLFLFGASLYWNGRRRAQNREQP